MAQLTGKKVACVATHGFEYSELTKPKKALEEAGATVEVVSIESDDIEGEAKGKPAGKVKVDKVIGDADASEYDALLLPGGVKNPDSLRLSDDAITFIKQFVDEEKPIFAICHGPWTLIDAGGAEGKKMTSWPSLKVDLENAGADWVDEEVVRDGNLVTSRKPDDIPVFSAEAIKVLAERQ